MHQPSRQSALSIIRATALAAQPWANGAGSTREIARHPAQDAWDWRLSIAAIDAPAPFSSLPGIERELVLLHGEGVRLRFEDDGSERDVLPPHGRLRFDGGRVVHGAPVDGPASVFNLMWRPDRVDAECWLRPLVGTLALFAEQDETWVLHLVAGRVAGQSPGIERLHAGDTLVAGGQPGRLHVRLDGQGEALLMRLRPTTRR